MREVWVQSNRRLLVVGAALAAVGILLGGVLCMVSDSPLVKVLSAIILLAATGSLLFIAAMWRLPRLAFDGRSMLAYVQGARPIRIPIDIVECFLLGQGPALLPGEKHAKTETATLVVKLSDRAEEWSHVEVDPRLASWCDGYITIRGTWTEPLNVAVVNRLNVRLAEIAKSLPAQAAR
jgi:hypothetical protein